MTMFKCSVCGAIFFRYTLPKTLDYDRAKAYRVLHTKHGLCLHCAVDVHVLKERKFLGFATSRMLAFLEKQGLMTKAELENRNRVFSDVRLHVCPLNIKIIRGKHEILVDLNNLKRGENKVVFITDPYYRSILPIVARSEGTRAPRIFNNRSLKRVSFEFRDESIIVSDPKRYGRAIAVGFDDDKHDHLEPMIEFGARRSVIRAFSFPRELMASA